MILLTAYIYIWINISCWYIRHPTCRLHGRIDRQMGARAYRCPNSRIPSAKLFGYDCCAHAGLIDWRLPLFATKQFGLFVQQTYVGHFGAIVLLCHDLWTNVESHSWTAIAAQIPEWRCGLHSWFITRAIGYWNIYRYVLAWVSNWISCFSLSCFSLIRPNLFFVLFFQMQWSCWEWFCWLNLVHRPIYAREDSWQSLDWF